MLKEEEAEMRKRRRRRKGGGKGRRTETHHHPSPPPAGHFPPHPIAQTPVAAHTTPIAPSITATFFAQLRAASQVASAAKRAGERRP